MVDIYPDLSKLNTFQPYVFHPVQMEGFVHCLVFVFALLDLLDSVVKTEGKDYTSPLGNS